MTRGPLVFLGAGDVAVPSLFELTRAGETIALVVTQPDRPKGRGQKTVPTPVKEAALSLGLPVETPENVNDPEVLKRLAALAPEFLVVVDYGQMLRPPLLALAPGGAVNLHPSLLPLHRGPSPVAGALLAGDAQTGVSTMFLDQGMDSGPVIRQKAVAVLPGETAGELTERLARLGAGLLVETLAGLRTGEAHGHPQDDAKATLTHRIGREFCELDWTWDAATLARRVLALSPKPGARALLDGKLLKILRAAPALGHRSGEPGTVLAVREDGFDVACGSGAVTVLEVHPEGKRPMRAADFTRGGGLAPGARFAPPDRHQG